MGHDIKGTTAHDVCWIKYFSDNILYTCLTQERICWISVLDNVVTEYVKLNVQYMHIEDTGVHSNV